MPHGQPILQVIHDALLLGVLALAVSVVGVFEDGEYFPSLGAAVYLLVHEEFSLLDLSEVFVLFQQIFCLGLTAFDYCQRENCEESLAHQYDQWVLAQFPVLEKIYHPQVWKILDLQGEQILDW